MNQSEPGEAKMMLNRFVNGRLVEGWMNFDTLGMLQQLGVVPTMYR